MIYFDSDMSKSTNTVVYFDWKTVIYIYACGKCCTQFMLPMEVSVTSIGACANEIIPSINRLFVYKAKEGRHVRINTRQSRDNGSIGYSTKTNKTKTQENIWIIPKFCALSWGWSCCVSTSKKQKQKSYHTNSIFGLDKKKLDYLQRADNHENRRAFK